MAPNNTLSPMEFFSLAAKESVPNPGFLSPLFTLSESSQDASR
jgi:hypothetical protein